LLVGGQLVLWTLVPWSLATSLPLDVVSDGITWGHEWQWGYYKHPPLPSWAAELSFDALGNLGPFLLSQIAVAATYLFVFLLGRSFMPTRWAAIGTLLLAGVYYFSIPTPEFNHNVAQMPLWAAASLAYYRAWRTGALRWWAALGVAAGLGLLAKYSTVLLLVTMLAHLLSRRESRAAFRSVGPYAAIAVAIAIVSPHLVWLVRNGFPTLRYAMGRAGAPPGAERFFAPFKFLLAQAIDIAPALLAAAFAGMVVFRWRRDDEDLRFLAWTTLGPPLLTFLLSLATGMGTRDMWGTPMWNLTGLLLVQAAQVRWPQVSLPRLGYCFISFPLLGLAGFALADVVVPQMEGRPSRLEWPDRSISQTFADAWQNETHRPLKIVAADGWLGGLVAMRAHPRPSVWIDASYAKAPWITPAAVTREGALVLWRVRSTDKPPASLAALPGLSVLGVRSFAWPHNPAAPPLRIGYGVVPPYPR
jgi:4-amino-4-deoxy-L-arabinose transferase-like glycosyltransferase